MNLEEERSSGFNRSYLIILVSLAFFLSLYPLLRYGGWWGEQDTAEFTRVIYANMQDWSLVPQGKVYPYGYGYQALTLFAVQAAGISLGDFQRIVAILLVAWLVLPAWLAYRELTRSELAASLATLVLLVQPEFLFPLLRGTHEKFTRGLMFVCLYLLLRSLRARRLPHIAALTICFYLSAYALIAFNSFLSTSFILALILALGLLWLGGQRLNESQSTSDKVVTKLIYVSVSLLVIAFLFTFYAYPPATRQLGILRTAWDRMAALFLQVEETSSNPYQTVNTGWISVQVYFLVSLANWLLLGLTLPLWLKRSYTWFIRRSARPARHELALWAFYAAFAFLGAASVVVDISGAVSGNLQNRVFPSFAMIAAPVAGLWLASWQDMPPRLQRRVCKIASSVTLGVLMLLAVIKASSEPLLSNYWLFYTPGEQASVAWAEGALAGQGLWTGLGGRLAHGYTIQNGAAPMQVTLDPYVVEPFTHDYVVSDVTRLYALRTGQQLPVQADFLLTYDNGSAQIYHRRPRTPFQK